jgi:hypothetical protein
MVRLWAWGGVGGLLFGLGYWFLWGCRSCAVGWGPTSIVAFCVVAGGLVARSIGKDLLRT